MNATLSILLPLVVCLLGLAYLAVKKMWPEIARIMFFVGLLVLLFGLASAHLRLSIG